jgi:hypothetical protein
LEEEEEKFRGKRKEKARRNGREEVNEGKEIKKKGKLWR